MQTVTLVDTRPPGVVLSASQIERYDLCKRRWAFEYIAGIRPPPHPSAKLGLEIHHELEHWLRSARPPNKDTKAGRIAARMIKHLPPPGTGTVERDFYFTTKNGHHYTGFIDWSGVFESWPTTIDHKSTSNLQNAKTEVNLHNDVQAALYTLAGCAGFGTDEMQLFWNYGCTTGRDAEVRPVKTRVKLSVVSEKFERIIEPTAAEMIELRVQAPDPMSFPPTSSACGAFGGCPHQQRCNLSAKERLFGTMNQPPTLASRMASFPSAGNGFAANGFAPPPPPPGQAPQAPPQMPAAPPQAPAPQGFVMPQQGGFAPPTPPQAQPSSQAAPSGAFVPPSTPTQQAGAFAPPAPAQAPPATPQQQLTFSPEQAPNPPESGQVMPPAPEGAGKRSRGRPAGAKNKVKDEGGFDRETLFANAMFAMVQSPHWNGSPEMLFNAGEAALAAFDAKFPGETP